MTSLEKFCPSTTAPQAVQFLHQEFCQFTSLFAGLVLRSFSNTSRLQLSTILFKFGVSSTILTGRHLRLLYSARSGYRQDRRLCATGSLSQHVACYLRARFQTRIGKVVARPFEPGTSCLTAQRACKLDSIIRVYCQLSEAIFMITNF